MILRENGDGWQLFAVLLILALLGEALTPMLERFQAATTGTPSACSARSPAPRCSPSAAGARSVQIGETLAQLAPGERSSCVVRERSAACANQRRGARLLAVRICLVTPFAWSQPHDVNEHVAGIATALRARGHDVTVVAPSTRAADLRRGPPGAAPRRARRRDDRRRPGRARLAPLADGRSGRRAREPRAGARAGAATTSSTASSPGCRRCRTSRFATPTRSPSRRSRRRTGSRTRRPARSARSCSAASTRCSRSRRGRATRPPSASPATTGVVAPGIDPSLFAPDAQAAADRRRAAPERARSRPQRAPRDARAARAGRRVLLRTKPLIGRPAIPRDLAGRVHVRTARDGASRAALLNETAIFVPGQDGLARVLLEAQAAGCAIATPRGSRRSPSSPAQPSRDSSRTTRCARPSRSARASAAAGELVRRRRGRARARSTSRWRSAAAHRAAPPTRSPTGRGSSPTCTCTPRGRSTARSIPSS